MDETVRTGPAIATRRDFLNGAGAVLAVGAGGRAGAAQGGRMPGFAYVGCRTSRERNARGDGIGVYRIGRDGAWTRVQLLGDLVNPSYLAFDRTRRFLYTVHGDGSERAPSASTPPRGG